MEYFTQNELTTFSNCARRPYDKNNEDDKRKFTLVRTLYDKLGHLAKMVQEAASPEGKMKIIRNPLNTNGTVFMRYLWAQVYPTLELAEEKTLAFTVSIDSDKRVDIKIDTVGLDDGHPIRKKYLEWRGEYDESPIVKSFSFDEALSLNWDKLTKVMAKSMTDMLDDYYQFRKTMKSGEIDTPKNVTTEYPLNQILYGPPGTGKTYSTIFHAVAIIEKKKIIEVKKEDSKDIKRRFDQYKNSGRIAMVTFHQSFSYEDFVEGIKPVMNRDNDEQSEVGYQVEDGIFKIMAESAKTLKSLSSNNGGSDKPDLTIDDDTLQQAEFYKMSLGNTLSPEDDDIYQYCIENNCVALGWGSNIDFSDIENEQQLKELLKEKEIGSDKGYGFTLTAIKCLRFWMKEGDIIFISNGNKRLRAIAQISGGYFFDEATPIAYSQFRRVKWLYTDIDIPVNFIYERIFSQATLYRMYKGLVKKDFFRKKEVYEEGQQTNNAVLIIDEINRSNVSAIMGELITLIEKDKRAGETNAMSTQLPYSKTEFSVPSNLYLIGTMNTADRSVEALDTALRRRFSFTEVGPKPELLSPKSMIVHLLNVGGYADLYWEEEPYHSHALKLYDFLGVEIDLVEAPLKKKMEALPEEEEIHWGKEDLSHLTANHFKGIQMDSMLEAINSRIHRLIDKDHMIGHAYFMGIATAIDPWQALKEVFHRNLLPLLQEYFFGDHGKIGLVLGNGFVVKEEAKAKFGFAAFDHPAAEDFSDRIVYRLVDVAEMDMDLFREAVQAILPATQTESND